MHYAITYVSTANAALNQEAIVNLLKQVKENNNRNNITGILLFSEGNFFQVIEGEKDKIQSLFKDIQKDSRHHGIITVFQKAIQRESFEGYKTDFISESARYDEETFQNYLNQLKVLDKPSQEIVKTILKAFAK